MNDWGRWLTSKIWIDRWSRFNFLFQSWFGRASLAIPLVGYAIIFGDQTSTFFSVENSISKDLNILYIDADLRKNLLYVGLIVILFSCLLYFLIAPKVVRVSNNRFTYIENALNNFSLQDYRFAAAYLEKNCIDKLDQMEKRDLKVFSESSTIDGFYLSSPRTGIGDGIKISLKGMLSSYYFHRDKSRRFGLFICVFLLAIGYLLVLVPTADIFIAILRLIYRDYFGGPTID